MPGTMPVQVLIAGELSMVDSEESQITHVPCVHEEVLHARVPDHSNQPQFLPSPSAELSPTLTLKDPIPVELAALGREVLELVPRKERDSLGVPAGSE